MDSTPGFRQSEAFWRRHALLFFPMSLSLAVIWSHFQQAPLTMDGVTYLQIARNALNGIGLGWQALWAPPLHSLLVAALARLTGSSDLLWMATLLAALGGFLLVPLSYAFTLQLFERRTALIAATLTALSPHLHQISRSPEAEISYTFFLLLALLLMTLALQKEGWLYPAGAGLAFALAYLARSEGFLVLGFVTCALLALCLGRRASASLATKCAVVLTVFLVSASPYLFFLKGHYGHWVISPKSSYVMTWMKCATYHDNDLGEEENPELWGLNQAGQLRWQEPKGMGDLARFLASHPGKSLAVYLHDLSGEIPGRIPNGSGMESFPQVFPVYLALAALVAVFLDWGPLGRAKKAVALAPFGVLLVLPVFTAGWWKYLVPYLPLLITLAARGLSRSAAFLAQRLRCGGSLREPALLLVLVGGFLVAYASPLLPAPGAPRQAAPASLKNLVRADAARAGAFGRQLLGPGKNFMVSWSPLVYYLDGIWTARPVADYQDQLDYARRNKVDYIVYDLSRPDISLEAMTFAPGLEVVGTYQSPDSPFKAVFFRLPPAPP